MLPYILKFVGPIRACRYVVYIKCIKLRALRWRASQSVSMVRLQNMLNILSSLRHNKFCLKHFSMLYKTIDYSYNKRPNHRFVSEKLVGPV
jgi:hypothetical protein